MFKTEREKKIAAAIEPSMIEAWLVDLEGLESLYYHLRRGHNLDEDVKFSEFADVFVLLAEHYTVEEDR